MATTLRPTSSSCYAERDARAHEHLCRAAASDRHTAQRLRDQVVEDNRGTAIALAHRYDGRGIEHEDLVQVAMLGLVNAVRRYRPGESPGFMAFAVPTITGELKRHFRDHGWAVRPPRILQERTREVRAVRDELIQELGHDPTPADIADESGLSEREVDDALVADGQYSARSLDAPIGHDRDDDGGSVMDTVIDAEWCREQERIENFAILRPALRRLSDRDRGIVRMRFVDGLSQRQIGERIGVSQMQVSRLLFTILSRLRDEIEPPDGLRSAS